MPYKIRKNRNKNTFKVYNPETGRVYSKATTLKNAEAQIRLLYMIDRMNTS